MLFLHGHEFHLDLVDGKIATHHCCHGEVATAVRVAVDQKVAAYCQLVHQLSYGVLELKLGVVHTRQRCQARHVEVKTGKWHQVDRKLAQI